MRHRSFLLALLILLTGAAFGALPGAAFANSHSSRKRDAKREIELLEQQCRTALLTGDVQAMDRLLSDDYVGIGMNGQVTTKLQQLDRIRARNLVLTQFDLSDVKVKLVGAVAIVTSLASVQGSNDGKPVSGTYRYTRVYQRLPNGIWQITNFESTRVPPGRLVRDQNDGTHP